MWGSAFSILFNRLVAKTKPGESGGKQKTKEVMNLLRQEQMQGKMKLLIENHFYLKIKSFKLKKILCRHIRVNNKKEINTFLVICCF